MSKDAVRGKAASTDVITSKAVSKDVVRGKVVCFFYQREGRRQLGCYQREGTD